MIERVKKFVPEFDALRKADFEGPDIPALANSISFPEVRELDLLCKGALEKHASDYPEFTELASRWYVHGSTGSEYPKELHTDLTQKRTVLNHALNVATVGSMSDSGKASEELGGSKGRWPTLLGRIQFVPRGLGIVAEIGGGVAVLLLVSHWVLGLF
ncbi:MAG TPA: hypothetical protein VFJ65_10965 [Solirubrobacterales bacterium]|nr:hypothetical protein [Solirubrobacterales bacterium]